MPIKVDSDVRLAASPHNRTAGLLFRRIDRPPDALAQVDANLSRVGQRFEWGDIDAAEYQDKRARLLTLRAEILATQPIAPRLIVSGLVAAWDADNKAIRNRLLLNLFAELDVTDGRIIGALPRFEVAAEVSDRLEGWPGLDGPLRLRFG